MKGFTIIVLIFFFLNCSSVQFRDDDNFWDWMKGPAGVRGKSGTNVNPMSEPEHGTIIGKRHPFYLWFRTPEIIFNPQGWIYYPDMIVEFNGKFYNTTELSNIKDERLKETILMRRSNFFRYHEAGLVEYVLPYREIIDGRPSNAVFYFFLSPILIPITYIERLIFYPIHDVIKTVMIPVAAVYYTVKAFDDNGEEEPAE